MRKLDRSQVLTFILGLLVMIIIVAVFLRPRDERPAPSSSGYYGGMMMNKSRSGFADDKGHFVPVAPGTGAQSKTAIQNLPPP